MKKRVVCEIRNVGIYETVLKLEDDETLAKKTQILRKYCRSIEKYIKNDRDDEDEPTFLVNNDDFCWSRLKKEILDICANDSSLSLQPSGWNGLNELRIFVTNVSNVPLPPELSGLVCCTFRVV